MRARVAASTTGSTGSGRSAIGDGEHPDLEEQRAAVDAFAASEGHRRAEDEERARDDGARDRAEDDARAGCR